MCSRCCRFSYPCFYSPARRIGRPHPPRDKRSRGKHESTADPLERQPLNRPKNESGGSESNISSDEGQSSQGYHAGAKTINNLQGLDNNFNSDPIFDLHGSATPQTEMFPQTDHYDVPKSRHPRHKNHMGDTALFNFDDRVNRAKLSEVDGLYCQGISSDVTSTLLPVPSDSSSSTSSRLDYHFSEVSAYGEGSTSNAPEHDCVTVVINMLQDLNMTSVQRPPDPRSTGEIEAPTFDALINTTSIAMKQVPTILVCPCSQKADVGLLVATVCATMLDAYESTIRNSSSFNHNRFSTNKPTYAAASSVNDMMMDVDMMEIGTQPLQDGPSKEEMIARILEKLPKVANLIRQFSARYNEDVEQSSAGLLSLLAGYLKFRLHSMTNEATNLLAHV